MRESNFQFRITLVASELSKPALGDIALFIYDFDSLYEVSRLSADPKYEDYKFSRYALYRNGRPIDSDDRMRVEMLRLESPLELSATIVAYSAAASSVLATLLVLIRVLEKVSNFRPNREKLALEILKLKQDLGMTGEGPERALRDDPTDYDLKHHAPQF